jgi:hypothetical protein
MRKILTSSKDTTLYQAFPTTNAGLDEILEIGKTIDTSLVDVNYVSASARTLIEFSLPTTESVSANANYFLNLRLANADNLKRNQELKVYLVSQSWDEGSGTFYQNVKNSNDGATWTQTDVNTSWSMAGGDFITVPSQSVTLSSFPLQDIRIDVTDVVRPIVSQSLQSTFYGLALQFPVTDENDADNRGNIKVFSTQTHTIYQPTLEVAWDDQVFSTGSLRPIPSLNVKIVPNNIRDVYTKGDVDRVSFIVRDQYPLKSFDSVLRYKNKYYLPASSYYSIVDTQSNTTIVPFDEYSKVSTDVVGSYLVLDTSPLYIGRFYTIKLKVVSGQYVRTMDTGILFKVQ